MTDQGVVPQGSSYGLAVAALQQCPELPACIAIHPDHVLWPCSSGSLTPETFQLLEIAASVLSACKSRHVPVALVVPLTEHDSIVQCLRDANLAQLFAAVVHYADDHKESQEEQQQRQRQRGVPASWSAAASALKAKVGAPWQRMLLFSADPAAVRTAQRLGMASLQVPSGSGLTERELQAGLQAYVDKLESDRGY